MKIKIYFRLFLLMIVQMLGFALSGGRYKADLINQWKEAKISLTLHYNKRNNPK